MLYFDYVEIPRGLFLLELPWAAFGSIYIFFLYVVQTVR